MQAHPSAVCNPVSHQCSGVANTEGETLDKVEEAIAGMVARKRVKTLDKDEEAMAGMMAKETIKKLDMVEEIIAVYEPYKKLAR